MAHYFQQNRVIKEKQKPNLQLRFEKMERTLTQDDIVEGAELESEKFGNQ